MSLRFYMVDRHAGPMSSPIKEILRECPTRKTVFAFPVDDLRRLVCAIYEAVPLPSEHARLIADLLIDTELRGVVSHGVTQVERYVRSFQEGARPILILPSGFSTRVPRPPRSAGTAAWG